MFHWICPECGCEIPPTVKECPTCDPQAAPVSKATAEAPAPLTEVPEVVPQEAAAASETPPPLPVAATPEPAPELPLDPLLAMAEQVRAAQGEPAVVAGSVDQAVATAAATPPVEEPPPPPAIPAVPAAETEPQLVLFAAEPEPEPAAPVAESTGLVELATVVGVADALPASQEAAPVAPPPLPREQVAAIQPMVGSMALLAPPAEPAITPLLLAPPAPETLAPEPAKPESSVTPPAEKPAVDSPPSGSWLSLAPLQDYSRAATRAMQPAAPNGKIVASDSGPSMTLPGPALPPGLVSFQGGSVAVAAGREPKSKTTRSGIPGWAVSFLVMLVLLVVGVSAVYYLLPSSHSNADTKDLPAEEQTAAPQGGSHPLAQSIEVTGFRIVVDFNKKSEIHYLVVNHSAAALSNMTVYVTLRSAIAKPGQAPISRFSFKAPDLGPFEAKEMISSIEKPNRSLTLPDWSDLRAEVQVAQ